MATFVYERQTEIREPELKVLRSAEYLLKNADFDEIKSTLELVVDEINGKWYGRRHRWKRRREVRLPEDKDIQSIVDCPGGSYDIRAELTTSTRSHTLSRLGVGWWTSPEDIKYVRCFGDRIEIKHMVISPPLFPMGTDHFYVVFPADSPNCKGCNTFLGVGKGHHRGNYFVCDACLYQEETGLRPATIKKRKAKHK